MSNELIKQVGRKLISHGVWCASSLAWCGLSMAASRRASSAQVPRPSRAGAHLSFPPCAQRYGQIRAKARFRRRPRRTARRGKRWLWTGAPPLGGWRGHRRGPSRAFRSRGLGRGAASASQAARAARGSSRPRARRTRRGPPTHKEAAVAAAAAAERAVRRPRTASGCAPTLPPPQAPTPTLVS